MTSIDQKVLGPILGSVARILCSRGLFSDMFGLGVYVRQFPLSCAVLGALALCQLQMKASPLIVSIIL